MLLLSRNYSIMLIKTHPVFLEKTMTANSHPHDLAHDLTHDLAHDLARDLAHDLAHDLAPT